MNRYLFLLLSMVFLLVSCSDDDIIEQPKIEASMFQGVWYCPESATSLEMRYSSFAGEVYAGMDSIPSEAESFHGKWYFLPATQQIHMNTSYHVSKVTNTSVYKVLDVNALSMTLQDVELNAEYTYYKVEEVHELPLGHSLDISLPDYPGPSFSTTSDLIAEVSNLGRVQARGSGTAFVRVASGANTVYVKIDVSPRPNCYAEELKNCTIDDIIERYGTPTFQGASDTPTMVATYRDDNINDTSLEYMHYKYDETTRQITQIVTLYKNLDSFYADWQFLRDNYFEITEGAFGEHEWLLNNSYYILPLHQLQEDGDFYHIDYTSIDYYLEHGYY